VVGLRQGDSWRQLWAEEHVRHVLFQRDKGVHEGLLSKKNGWASCHVEKEVLTAHMDQAVSSGGGTASRARKTPAMNQSL